jgi:hypothetical protein
MSEIDNLRRARKGKARDAKEQEAANNRAKHGVAKPVRDLADARNAKAAKELNAHKLDTEK